MTQTNLIIGVLVFALLIYMIWRHTTPRIPTRLQFYLIPIVTLLLAFRNFKTPTENIIIIDVMISLALSIIFGVLQANFTRLYESDGKWLLKGDWRYIASWVALLIIRLALTGIVTFLGYEGAHAQWIIYLQIAVVFGARSFVLHRRYPQLSTILSKQSKRR